MKKRIRKKMTDWRKISEQMRALNDDVLILCKQLQDNMTRLTWLLKENTNLISRFPIKVEDFVTNPPIHNGAYLVYFVRKDGVRVRFYTMVGSKWYDSQKNEVDIKSLYPSCYLQTPVLSEDAIDIYKRRSR